MTKESKYQASGPLTGSNPTVGPKQATVPETSGDVNKAPGTQRALVQQQEEQNPWNKSTSPDSGKIRWTLPIGSPIGSSLRKVPPPPPPEPSEPTKFESMLENLKKEYQAQFRDNFDSGSKQKEENAQLKIECERLREENSRLKAECVSKDLDVQELRQEMVNAKLEARDAEQNLKEQLDEMMSSLLEKEHANDRLMMQLQRYGDLERNPYHLQTDSEDSTVGSKKGKDARRATAKKKDKKVKCEKKTIKQELPSDADSEKTGTDADLSPSSGDDQRKKTKAYASKRLKLILAWSKMVPEIARMVPKLKTTEDLYKWRFAWSKRRKRYSYIKKEWLTMPKFGESTNFNPPEDETEEEEEVRKAVASAIMSTIDLTNTDLKAWMDGADELHPRSVYCRALQYYQQMNVKSSNRLSTAFTSTTMASTGATVLTYGKVVKELVRRQEELGDAVGQKRACETYLLGLLPQFDPIRDEIRKQHRATNEYDLTATVKAVEDWATNERCDRDITDLTCNNKAKIDHKLVAEIKTLTGETTTKVLQTNTSDVKTGQQQSKQKHPLGAAGCYHWWAKGQCRYDKRCYKAATHTDEYKLKGKKSDSTSSGKKIPNPAEKYKDHTCGSCGNKGHTPGWSQCPAKKGQTNTSAKVTTNTSTTNQPPSSATPSVTPTKNGDDVDIKKMLIDIKSRQDKQDKILAMLSVKLLDEHIVPDPADLTHYPHLSRHN